jgi:Family of unknown function (DUF5522)
VADSEPLDDRPLTQPARARLPLGTPQREQLLRAHEQAMVAGDAMYVDPVTGLSVLTAKFLAERGWCCGRGCRHCPYVEDVTS